MEKDNHFFTRDFYLACYILSKGCKLLSCSKERGITTFCFQDENIAGLAEKYYSMTALVEPISYGNSMKTMKSIIHRTDANSGKLNNGIKF